MSEAAKRQLAVLDRIEKRAESDIPSCCSCHNYWEDPRVPKAWGFCRRYAPRVSRDDVLVSEPAPAVDFDWFCGEYEPRLHQDVLVQRRKWRQQLELMAGVDDGPEEGSAVAE